MTFSAFIQNRREELGLSLRTAAKRVGFDAAYLSRVEAGKIPPSGQLIHHLAQLLLCTEDELLLLAGKLPPSLQKMVEQEPYRVSAALRSIAEMAVADPGAPYGKPILAEQGERAIEDSFPFEVISDIAEVESWRKEVYRPIYHVHKWWAQRLGSVFRAAILGSVAPKGSSVMDLFYEPVRLPGVVIFDPFMGSGTTVGEAHKLGCTVIGRDINPVAYRAVRTALGPMNRREVVRQFERLRSAIAPDLREHYRSLDSDGQTCDVLYYFWVKILPCPKCGQSVDLFPTFIFARHVYVKRNPVVQVVCPNCSAIFPSVYDSKKVACAECDVRFNPHSGWAKRTTAICKYCRHEFPIAKTARSAGHPPSHRMYAKLVLQNDGTKEYLPITQEDLDAFAAVQRRLLSLDPQLPRVRIPDGYNTRQILNYGYRYWDELFNERQLLALTLLAKAIRELPEGTARDTFAILFSGVLEFNNMFASYKGEGTGAVRHMFSHHILKPERMPIEANVWGTPKSSGAFCTLYHSRLLRALDYREAPFEIAVERAGKRNKGRKVFGVSAPIGGNILKSYPKGGLKPGAIYLSCGSSTNIDLPDSSVDLVITDPPFFDNVHYSELADFFYAWQELYFNHKEPTSAISTTRHCEEVQDVDADLFADKLKRVFQECHRVLREDGLLVFSYHHSREDGWSAIARAVLGAGFSLVQCQPAKSEMSVAAPKSQAKEPIDLDVLLVCRKRTHDRRPRLTVDEALDRAGTEAAKKISRFNRAGRRLSRNDVLVVLLSQLLVELSASHTVESMVADLDGLLPKTRSLIEQLWTEQHVETPANDAAPDERQLNLLDLAK